MEKITPIRNKNNFFLFSSNFACVCNGKGRKISESDEKLPPFAMRTSTSLKWKLNSSIYSKFRRNYF